MPRSGEDARRRLREAALTLYGVHGYDATTSAQIAERAGVTERTFFRHFADKREVLFGGESELRDTMVEAIAGAASTDSPLDLVVAAYQAALPLFVRGREVAQRRAELIAVTPALQERAHAKAAALADAVVDALSARGIPPATARLAAQVGGAAFQRAGAQWYADPSLDLAALVRDAVEEVRRL